MLLVFGCSSEKEEGVNSIRPGLYEIEFQVTYQEQPIMVRQQVRYKDDGTYAATTYNNNVAVEELKGEYRVEGGTLEWSDKYRRIITADGTWTTWQPMTPSKVEIQNITDNSFQYLFQAPNEDVRKQFEVLGLSEGWKTYQRIGS